MDPRSSASPALFAPGPSSPSAYAPGRDQPLPAVDDRLVAPEARAEIMDGVVVRAMPSNHPHGTRHFEAAGVFFGVLAEGYSGAVDMLTRLDEDSDAAPDVSVFPTALDPETGGRQLEEIAFEVLDSERLAHVTRKIEKLAKRGVRRLFAVRVAARAVYEWDHAHGDWTQLPDDGEIVDRCFRVPLPTAALVDRVLADETVARGLLASRNAVIERALELREARGEARGEAKALLRILARRGITVDDTARARLTACADTARLELWIDRAVTATSMEEVFAD